MNLQQTKLNKRFFGHQMLMIGLFLFICFGCRESELPISVTESDLVGNWEAYSYQYPPDSSVASEPSLMLYSAYCSAFKLRENQELALYYWRTGKPDEDRVDGNWSIENGNELVFTFWGNWSKKVRITKFEGTSMEISELLEEDFDSSIGIFQLEKR